MTMCFVKATAITSVGKDASGFCKNVLSYVAVSMTNDEPAQWLEARA